MDTLGRGTGRLYAGREDRARYMTSFATTRLASGGRSQPLEFDWNVRFTRPATIQAYAYWRSCCGDRPMPRREDLDPRAMRGFSPHVGLIEIRQDLAPHTEYFIRRAGGKWEDVYGPITGRYIHEFLPPEIEPSWRAVFDTVRERMAPVRVRTGIDFQNKTWLTTEMLVAPLGTQERITMLFMTFVAWSTAEFSGETGLS